MKQVVELKMGDRTVLMQLLTPSAMVNAARIARGSGLMVLGEAAAKMAVVRVDGQDVDYARLEAGLWKKLFPRTRQKVALVKAFNKVHSPSPVQYARFLASLKVELGEGGERWTGVLPSGKTIVMAEPPLDTIDDVLNAATLGAKSPAAQQLLLAQESARKSLVSLDGEPVKAEDLRGDAWDERFSVVDTLLMGLMWERAFGGDGEEFSMGEVQPATGT